MWTAGRTAKKVFKQPGAFALSVIKQFRANQGVLLAGAVAYYTLLSLVPLLILILMALSHIIPEDRLLLTLSEYLEFVVPGQSTALVEEVRTFLAEKQVVGGILFVTMLFFSASAFTILENAMSVIFYHRVKIKATFSGVRRDAIPIHPESGGNRSRDNRRLLVPGCRLASRRGPSQSIRLDHWDLDVGPIERRKFSRSHPQLDRE
jgi:hypothetical protein